jgi:CRP-like cAMP-binding protein
MSTVSTHTLALMVRKLQLWQPLGGDDVEAVLALPHTVRALAAGQYIVWDGDKPQHTCLLLDGFAYRHKVAGNGNRQILSIHMKGDIVDLQNSLLGIADHNVQMLTSGQVALIPVEAMRTLTFDHAHVGMAMWYETLVEGSIFREWIVNVGQRNAKTRIAHLLCEFAMRLEFAELGKQSSYELPITQEQLGEAVSLTSVHVNRMLMQLEEDGLISRTKRVITIHDWPKLAKTADFEPRYLHLQSGGSAAARQQLASE